MDNKKVKQFTDLFVWQKAHRLVINIYIITKKFPREELYSLVDQIKRAAVAITSNIAEGFGRQSYREKLQFYYIALSSLTEIQNQLIIAKDVGYILQKEFDHIFEETVEVYKIFNIFILKTKTFLK